MKTNQFGNTDVTNNDWPRGMPMSLSSRHRNLMPVIHRARRVPGVTLIDCDSYWQDESDKHHNSADLQALRQYHGDVSHVVIAAKGGFDAP